jgi:hypothetical protein
LSLPLQEECPKKKKSSPITNGFFIIDLVFFFFFIFIFLFLFFYFFFGYYVGHKQSLRDYRA